MRHRALLIGLAAGLFFTAPALAIEAKKRVEDQGITVDAAWSAIGDFCGIAAWHPAVAKCTLSEKDGATFRTLDLNGGGSILEKLESWSDAEHKYTYSIVESPLPVANYVSTLSTKADDDGGAGIRWTGTFDAKGATDDEAKAAIEGIYAAGLDGLLAKVKSGS
ncbi:SRPBCC family protein [Methylobrevis albus]|uniref:SRPBCC family protein n=1 Tax=Methylobrevis albus TaxID=2793297 RepID=A0A931I2L1_9HYPH|nr:SRPBCC family protein [Methylobrevis albus]MBH0238143.1 SRPBCC family protein [Methylobrevis albus]